MGYTVIALLQIKHKCMKKYSCLDKEIKSMQTHEPKQRVRREEERSRISSANMNINEAVNVDKISKDSALGDSLV